MGPQSVLIADLLELHGRLAAFAASVAERQARANAKVERRPDGRNARRAALDASPEAVHQHSAQTDALYDSIETRLQQIAGHLIDVRRYVPAPSRARAPTPSQNASGSRSLRYLTPVISDECIMSTTQGNRVLMGFLEMC